MSIESLPSSEASTVLAQLLAVTENSEPLVALKRDYFSICSWRDMQQLRVLFDNIPSGLAEVAWIKNRKDLESDCLAKLPMWMIFVERLGLLGCMIQVIATDLGAECFWEIIKKYWGKEEF